MLRNNPKWEMTLHPTDFYQSFNFNSETIPQVDGVIGFFRDGPIIDALIRSRTPVVNLTYSGSSVPFPFVTSNSASMGLLAADFLATNAHRRMVYIGPDGPVCRIRRGSFAHRVSTQTGKDVDIALYSHDNKGKMDELLDKHIFDHVKSSERVAVFAFSDSYAFGLIQAAIHRGYAIPEHVTVLGCDNDDRICEFSPVSISSIAVNGRDVGFRSAMMLHEILSGRSVPRETWIEPLSIVERASTSSFITNDAIVANAISLIRQNISTGINVSELSHMLSLSYRQLERLFQNDLGLSPKTVIKKMRIEKCKHLLSQGTLTNAQIAKACGYSNANVFEQAFKKLTGKRPKSYRIAASAKSKQDKPVNDPTPFHTSKKQ